MTVNDAIKNWRKLHGDADPRLMLDSKFHSMIIRGKSADQYFTITLWCIENFGQNNFIKSFDKYWFSTESEYTQFRLTWEDQNEQRYTRIQAFHEKGYQAALKDCDFFFRALAQKFGYLTIDNSSATMEQFLEIAAKEMNNCLGGSLYKEENNG